MQSDRSHEPAGVLRLERPRGLADLLAAQVAEAASRHRAHGGLPVEVTVDVAAGLDMPADPRLVRAAVMPLLEAAFAAAASRDRRRPGRAEVAVTAVAWSDRLEIEIADSGDAVEAERAAAAIHAAAARIGGTLTAARCPEGGSVQTLRLPWRRAGSRAA